MFLTLHQSLLMLSTAGAGWLMVRAGTAKHTLKVKVSRCASCGRRRRFGSCPCTHS
jgi:hypothetical protein